MEVPCYSASPPHTHTATPSRSYLGVPWTAWHGARHLLMSVLVGLAESCAPLHHPLPCHVLPALACALELLVNKANRSTYSTTALPSPTDTEANQFWGRLNPLQGTGRASEKPQRRGGPVSRAAAALSSTLPVPSTIFPCREHCRARTDTAPHLHAKLPPLVPTAVTLALLDNDNS